MILRLSDNRSKILFIPDSRCGAFVGTWLHKLSRNNFTNEMTLSDIKMLNKVSKKCNSWNLDKVVP